MRTTPKTEARAPRIVWNPLWAEERSFDEVFSVAIAGIGGCRMAPVLDEGKV